MQTDYRNSSRSGFIALTPVLLVSVFLLVIVGLSLSNSQSMLEDRVLKGHRQNTYGESVHCAHLLTNISDMTSSLREHNPALFAQSFLGQATLGDSKCNLRQVDLVESIGLYSGARFYRNFNFPLSGFYPDLI